MRLGILGGSFDPVHFGHLLLGECCRETCRLDEVWFVPAATPPHKQSQNLASAGQRVEMLQLAIGGHPAFRVSDLEIQRQGVSYTVDTLQQIQQQQPARRTLLAPGSGLAARSAVLEAAAATLPAGNARGRATSRLSRAAIRTARRPACRRNNWRRCAIAGGDAPDRTEQQRHSPTRGRCPAASAFERRGRSRSTSRRIGCTSTDRSLLRDNRH